MAFEKWQGIGNDFVLVDAFTQTLPDDLASLSQATCDRRFGIGGDGLILLAPGEKEALQMRMFNPDGSESEMCGNGIRCLALFAQALGRAGEGEVPVETGAGRLTVEVLADGRVRVDMGPARLTRSEIGMADPSDTRFVNETIPGHELQGTAVSMGNPHLVLFVDDVAAVNLEEIGPVLENHPLFPARVNVHFVQVVDRETLIQRTWERGAGITLACGTGACSVAVAAFLNGHSERTVMVHLPGGDLGIEYREDGRVLMTGPATKVFEGSW
ncbi:diaminopimelate epimerase [bacterium]|nr:MAG: diaminopimelate epimerase [bacterium]